MGWNGRIKEERKNLSFFKIFQSADLSSECMVTSLYNLFLSLNVVGFLIALFQKHSIFFFLVVFEKISETSRPLCLKRLWGLCLGLWGLKALTSRILLVLYEKFESFGWLVHSVKHF